MYCWVERDKPFLGVRRKFKKGKRGVAEMYYSKVWVTGHSGGKE